MRPKLPSPSLTVAQVQRLARQYDTEANGGLSDQQVPTSLRTPVWWRCPEGPDHHWQAPPRVRMRGTGCPFCAGKRASVTNDLNTEPDLADQLDEERNDGLRPDQLVAGTERRLWWRCPEGPDHHWQASGKRRVRGDGCPFCAGKRASVTNRLANHPTLAGQLDTVANDGLTAADVVAGSHRRLAWQCAAGPDHRWRAVVKDRVAGSGCPFCANQRVSVTNSLANHHRLAAQLDETANGGLTATDVVASTGRQLAWKCAEGPDHRWRARSVDRLAGQGCPFCAGKRVSVTNHLANHPKLAAQLDAAANGGLTAEQVVAGTDRRLWWRCPEGPDHTWTARGAARLRGQGCPSCANQRVSVTNSLANHPRLAAQLDVAANGGLTAEQVIAGTKQRLWWRCDEDPTHTWRATGQSRVHGTRCPECTLHATSAREIGLCAELEAVLAFTTHRAPVDLGDGGRPARVDVLDLTRRVAVEYDGAYFHAENDVADAAKTRRLLAAGFTVLRVRERPLAPVTGHDVACSQRTPIWLVAADVLDRLAELRPDVCPEMVVAAYRAAGRPAAAEPAEQRIAQLQRARRTRACDRTRASA